MFSFEKIVNCCNCFTISVEHEFFYNLEASYRGYKTFSCSTQLSMKFQQLKKLKYQQMKKSLALSLSDVFIKPIHVKMPKIVGTLTL